MSQGERIRHRNGAKGQNGLVRGHRTWKFHSDCVVRCTGAGVRELLIAPQPLELSFGRAEVGSLFIGVFIGTIVCGDGHSNWFKGVQLVTVYIIVATMFYF